MACSSFAQNAGTQQSVRSLTLVPADGAGGIAVAVLIDGRLLFFDEGFADLSERQPITSDSLFNVASLRKPFEATLLALAVQQGKMAFDDPVSAATSAASRWVSSRPIGRGFCCRTTIHRGRQHATRRRASSKPSRPGSRSCPPRQP
jgi:CubicO group peptidase (beta-lactamase class C family)